MIHNKKFVAGLSGYAKYLPPLALAALGVSSFCTHTPENCADGQELKPGMFCFDNKAYNKCGGNEYNPYAQFCSAAGAVYDKCNGKDDYDPLREFCSANKVVPKCGGGGTGGVVYDPETQGCVSGIVKERCGNNHFDPNNEFCFNNVRIYNKCDGKTFDPTTESCKGEAVMPKCGTENYNPETQFCYNNNVYPKCNGNEYDPAEKFCYGGATYTLCGGREYDPSKQTCNGTTIAEIVGPPKCNGVEYDGAANFCYNNTTIYDKCGGNVYDPTRQYCDGTRVADIVILPKCGGVEYDSTVRFCHNNTTIYDKCGGKAYDPSSKTCNGTNIVDIVKVTVYFNTNGGTDGVDPPKPVTTDPNTAITLPGQQTMGRDGFSFGGWNTSNLGSGTGYKAGDSYTVTGTTNLYAKWIPIYTVTFNANNATNGEPHELMKADSGTAISLPDKGTLARTGYSFGGWNTSGSGGINYQTGASYTVTGNTTLYARWIPIYAVAFNGNGATVGVPDTVRADSGTVITIPGQGTMTRTGYSFGGGWSTTGSGGINYPVDTSYTVINNATLYAQWIPIYTVVFNSNNATSGTAPDTVRVNSGTVITLPEQGNMVRTNYHFGGWSTSSGGGTSYSAGSSYTVTSTTTLYAKWTAYPTYTVTYNGNGNTSGSVTAAQVDSGSIITLPGNGTMVKTGYNFGGWNTNSAGTGTDYSVGASYTITKNDTLYAKWTNKAYTVIFDGNGYTSGSIPAPMYADDYGSNITLPSQGTMTRTGYSFGGWNTSSSGTGTNYNAGASYSITSTVTLYAKWTATSYTITYTLNNGTVSSANPTSYTIETATFTLNNPTRTGYTFTGWTGSNGTSPQTSVSVAKGSIGDKSYTATWQATPNKCGTDGTAGSCKTVTIGGKIWMAENLNIVTENSWCYVNSSDSCAKYGRLYTWEAAKTACPSGWHLPSRSEWDDLVTAAGGYSTAGKKLKSTSGWNSYSGASGNGTDDFGFSALPGGLRYSDGAFDDAGYYGSWWTATEYSGEFAYRRSMYYYGDDVNEYYYYESRGFAVRCLAD